MREPLRRELLLYFLLTASLFVVPQVGRAQEAAEPQTLAPPPVTPPQPAVAANPAPREMIRIPAGTRVAVVLENGISTRS
ncbi:MAG: hypothetical protein WA789_04625, partial [Candidatus Acidiferrum sp.]